MTSDDERDYEEEAANRRLMEEPDHPLAPDSSQNPREVLADLLTMSRYDLRIAVDGDNSDRVIVEWDDPAGGTCALWADAPVLIRSSPPIPFDRT
jgi:hypothetical protein